MIFFLGDHLDFIDINNRLDQNKKVIALLEQKNIDPLIIKRLEAAMVRDTLILIHTTYQENIKGAIITKIKRLSDGNEEIVNFVKAKIKKTDIKIDSLKNFLNLLNQIYESKFDKQLDNNEEITMYSNILTARIKVAHENGNNLKIGSLKELEMTHEKGKQILVKFESSLW